MTNDAEEKDIIQEIETRIGKLPFTFEDLTYIHNHLEYLSLEQCDIFKDKIERLIDKYKTSFKYLSWLQLFLNTQPFKDISKEISKNDEDALEKYRKLGLMKEYPIESTKDKIKYYHGDAIQESMHLMRILPYSILEEYSEPSKNNPNTKIVNVDKIPEKIKQFYEITGAVRLCRK